MINDVNKYYFFKNICYYENKYYEELYKIIEVIYNNEKYLILLFKVYNLDFQTNRLKFINFINIFSNKSIFYITHFSYIIDKDMTILSLSIKIPKDFKITNIKSFYEIKDLILNKKYFVNKVHKLYKKMIKLDFLINDIFNYNDLFFTLKNNKINKIYYINDLDTIKTYINNINNSDKILSENKNVYFTNQLIYNKIIIIK
jgi:hypothetical protein